jgi:hypothetical protein
MARATLEMFLKLTGANKTSQGLDKVSKSTKKLDTDVKNSTKKNAEFSAGMSGLGKTAIAGASLFAAKSLLDFSVSAIQAASSAQEAAGAFGTTFAGAAEKLNGELAKNANLFGLTTSEAQQLISVFGSVAQGIGFTQEESADLSSDLFNLAGDIASFNNITAGAAPVLQAFRSALVGEREALKTYGIAITEAEVQTKAFEQTGKTSADALTRQEKALATTALIFERSAVQQGNAAREASGFAAQTLIARSATQELREELGEQLLPAAGEILRTFNEIREDSTPALIDRFSDLNLQVLGVVKTFNDLRDVLTFTNDQQLELSDITTNRLTGGFKALGLALKAQGIVARGEIIVRQNQIKSTQELTEQLDNYKSNTDAITKSMQKNRTQTNINRVAQEKYETLLNKKSLPTLEKYLKFMNLLNEENDDVIDRSKELSDAQDRVSEAQRKEALSTAEEALQKKELQKEIAELLFFQKQGADVSEELAVAQEKLRLIEFELTRESEELRDAKADLAEVEAELVPKVEETTDSLAAQTEKFIELNKKVDAFKELAADEEFMAIAKEANIANPFLATGLGLMSGLAKLQGLNERAIELNRFAQAAERLAKAQAGLFDDVPTTQFTPPVIKPEDLLPPNFIDKGLLDALADYGNGAVVDGDILGDQTNIKSGNNGGGDTNLNLTLELDGEAIQKFNTKIQQQGKTFLVS